MLPCSAVHVDYITTYLDTDTEDVTRDTYMYMYLGTYLGSVTLDIGNFLKLLRFIT